MATLIAHQQFNINFVDLNYYSVNQLNVQFLNDIFLNVLGTVYEDIVSVNAIAGDKLIFGGHSVTFDANGEATGGTVNYVEEFHPVFGILWQAFGFSIPAVAVDAAIQSPSNADDLSLIADGFSGDDMMEMSAFDDVMNGFDGNDTIKGKAGNDTLNGGKGKDKLLGGDGKDILSGGSGNDMIFGGKGKDKLSGNSGADQIEGGDGKDTILGGSGGDTILGGSGNDSIDGGKGNDSLTAGSGDDQIFGGKGNDKLFVSKGNDTYTGGDGSDKFIFDKANQFVGRNDSNTILDFEKGSDRIDLRGVDANSNSAVDDAFVFIGATSFSGAAGELRVTQIASGDWRINGDVDGDGNRDFQIVVEDFGGVLDASDFLL